MRILKTNPIKKPKVLKKSDRDKINKILKDNRNLLDDNELRIFKKELESVK
jgi:hypothetical protein